MTGEVVDLGSGCSFSNRIFGTSGPVTIGAEWRIHSAYPVGSVVNTTWSSITGSPDVQPGHLFIQLKDIEGRTLWQEFHNPGSGAGSRSVTLGNATQTLVYGIGAGNNGPNSSISWNGVSMAANPCGPP